jgi:hypothetical protein
MTCISDIDECRFDCIRNPSLCGPGETCSQGIQCVPTVPDAGAGICAPGGGTATSGLNESKTLGALTSTEQATFCDWAAGVTGGYGCRGAGCGSITFVGSQAECVSKLMKAGCPATVSQAEACLEDNAQNVCLLKILSSPTCLPLKPCIGL